MSKPTPWKADDIGNVYRDTETMRDDPIGFFHDPKYAWQARDAINFYAALVNVAEVAEKLLTEVRLYEGIDGAFRCSKSLESALDELKKAREAK